MLVDFSFSPRQCTFDLLCYAQDDGEVPAAAQPIICNNLERALLLSLKYQFVTPLTSLVVVKPDVVEDGDIREADLFNRKIRVVSGARGLAAARGLALVMVTMLGLNLW